MCCHVECCHRRHHQRYRPGRRPPGYCGGPTALPLAGPGTPDARHADAAFRLVDTSAAGGLLSAVDFVAHFFVYGATAETVAKVRQRGIGYRDRFAGGGGLRRRGGRRCGGCGRRRYQSAVLDPVDGAELDLDVLHVFAEHLRRREGTWKMYVEPSMNVFEIRCFYA